jgi:hypothetical protein
MSESLPQTHEDVIARYEEKLAAQQESVARCDRRWSGVGWLRGIMFLLSLAPIILVVNQVFGYTVEWFYLCGLIFFGFLVVAYIHEGIQAELRRASLKANMYKESLARCHRQWDKIKMPSVEVEPEFRPISNDLDLFTESSIFKLLGITRTPQGMEHLIGWIREGAFPEEVRARQAAVQELTPKLQWREEFGLLCEQLSSSKAGPSRLVEWAESSNWFDDGRRWLLWLARLTAVAALILIIALLFGILPLTVAGPGLLVVIAINFGLGVVYAGSIHEEFNQVSTQANEAFHYVELFNRVTKLKVTAPRLVELQDRLKSSDDGAQANIRRLSKIIDLANMRRGMGFPLYLALEWIFFWDVHVLDLLERWKARTGKKSKQWFQDLGQWEALCALAKLAADEPNWIYPEVYSADAKRPAIVEGEQIGHPLLGQERVPNDVQMGPAGTVLLVTGSNMSGKSTVLRSVGANIVLAQMGSVVCAKTFSVPAVTIETSMRIADSLADGVSFFMAELKRLKAIVDTADAVEAEGKKTLLFLLDEILQGTNSRERQIAVSRVVRKLIDERAIGAISTHDLDLATTPELKTACQTVHFSEQFVEVDGKKKMTFDYRMKKGIAETTNALKLLEMVGLGE